MEPFSATIYMTPTLKMHTLWIVAHEQICFQIIIIRTRTVAFDMGLTITVQIRFISGNPAIWTGKV
jgi:hypothetical protein